MALSITFCSVGLAFSNSAHRARGTTQNASYVYRRGFSFTSADCAHAGAAQPPAITIAHNPDMNCQLFFFIENPLWLVFDPMKYTSNRSDEVADAVPAEERGFTRRPTSSVVGGSATVNPTVRTGSRFVTRTRSSRASAKRKRGVRRSEECVHRL